LLLAPNANNVDLTTWLPVDIQQKYKNKAFKERHIRIDQQFRAANGAGVVVNLKSHWHYTETYGDITIHLYFDYDLCVGVYIKAGDNPAIKGCDRLKEAALINAEDALQVVSTAIHEVAETKKQLRAHFEEKMQLLQIDKLKEVSQEVRNKLFRDCSNLNERLKFYNEDIVDTRFDMVSKIMQNISNITEHHKNEEEEEPEVPLIVPGATKATISSRVKVTKSKLHPKPAITIKNRAELLSEYKKIQASIPEKPNLNEIISINQQIQQLNQTLLEIFFITETDSEISKTCEMIQYALTRLRVPTLLSEFEKYARSGFATEAIRLFSYVSAEIPASFYADFILRIMKTRLTPEEQDNVNTLCNFFYRTSDDYRLYMSHLGDITTGDENEDGDYVGFSPFITLYLAGNLETFKILIEQCANKDPKGYVFGDKITSLVTILSLFSFESKAAGPYIQFLLDKGVKLEYGNMFAGGTLCTSPLVAESKELRRFNTDSKPSSAKKPLNTPNLFQDISALTLLPYFGSAIVAYVNSDYQCPEILKQMAERSSVIHVVRAFAYYCQMNTINRVLLEQERFGVKFVDNKDTMRNIIETSANESITDARNIRFAGIILRPADENNETITQNIKILHESVQQKILALKQDELTDVVIILQQSAQAYASKSLLQLCISCHKAILMLIATKLSPTIATHRLTLHTFSKLADLYDLAKQQIKIFNPSACETQIEENCDYATLLGYYSVFHNELMKDPTYLKAEKRFNEIQRMNNSQPSDPRPNPRNLS
jgi:hypothetical protein